MSIPVAYTRNMLRQYKNQMVSSRTLAYRQHALRAARGRSRRFRRRRSGKCLCNGWRARSSPTCSPSAVRIRWCLKREALNREFGTELEFCYLPGELEMVIYRKTPSGGTERLSPNEQTEAASRAWKIILKIVDEHCF